MNGRPVLQAVSVAVVVAALVVVVAAVRTSAHPGAIVLALIGMGFIGGAARRTS